MNEDANLSREQLEAATARELAAGSPLAAEAALLHERFLAFGRAVEQAGNSFDERALVERLAAAASQQHARVEIVRRDAKNRPLWLLLLGGALAASALIAVVRIASQWPAREQIASSEPAASPANPPNPAVSSAITVPDAETSAKLTSTAAVSSWDDPLDSEIATAEQQLSIMAGRTAALDGELTGIDQQLESLSSDLNGGSL